MNSECSITHRGANNGRRRKICPRCAETVKGAALVCKHCGHEFGTSGSSQENTSQGLVPLSTKGAPKKAHPIAAGCAMVFILLLVIGVLNSPSGQSSHMGDTDAASPTAVPPVRVTAVDLARAYDANEVQAQNEYGGQTLEVSGVVTGITLDMFSNPVVQMRGVNEFLPVQASFDKSYSGRLGTLSKGQVVTVRCTSVTEVISAPMLGDCTLP